MYMYVMFELIGIFWCSIVSLNLCKEYLNMAILKITFLLMMKSLIFDVWNAFLCHHIHEL